MLAALAMICILLSKVTPSVERSGHRDALSSSATIMIAWETEAMRGHFFVAWLVRPTSRDKTMFQSALRPRWIYVI